MSEISFRSGELNIHGTLVMPESNISDFPGVIIFHGMTSSEKGYIPLATDLAKIGIAGLAVSMRGHGESEGYFNKETVAGATEDAIAAYDFLINQRGVDADKIGMVGSSVGAILVSLATSKRNIKSLVLRAPAAYTEPMMQLTMAETMMNESRQFHEINDLAETPAGKAITKYDKNLLVVASENDATIPLSISQGYVSIAENAKQKKLVIIEGAAHTLTNPKWKETFKRTVLEWFTKTLK